MNEFMSIGQIINTHGIKGELKIYPLTDDIKRFKDLNTIYIDSEPRKICSCKLGTNKVILKIEGIDSIEDAEKFKNKYICVKRENAVKLPKGKYFIADIIGCSVFDENGVELGKVYDVIITGSNDVYWIKGKKEVLVPALKDIVVKIDVKEKKIIIKPLNVWYED